MFLNFTSQQSVNTDYNPQVGPCPSDPPLESATVFNVNGTS